MIRHRRHAGMADDTLVSIGRTGMAVVTMLGNPPGRMRIGVPRDYPPMADATLESVRRSRMAIVAMPGQPPGRMRIGMIRHRRHPGMADTALFRLGRSRMTVVAMLIPPTGGMRVGMRADAGFMTHRASGPRTLAGMTVVTMILAPTRIMGQRSGIGVTRIAGILLMTDQTSRPIPLRLDAMGFQPPQVVVRGGLGNLMAFPA